jgi:hypothetical protein
MPNDPKIISDIQHHIDNLAEGKDYLNVLYLSPEFVTPRNKPVIQALINAYDFIRVNLTEQLNQYKIR